MKKLLPYLILFSALSISISAAIFSVSGLAKLFAGGGLSIIIMASSLELSKLITASLLYQYWDKMNKWLRGYLTSAVCILMLITSMGIYGYLSSGYEKVVTKSDIVDKEISIIKLKKDRFEQSRADYVVEKAKLDESISQLRDGLSKGIITQHKDKTSGQILNSASSANRKAFEKQLDIALNNKIDVNNKIELNTDSITALDVKILNIESTHNLETELGPLKYLNKVTGVSMDKIINWLILVIVLVFDPLAVSLIIASNFAFSQNKKPIQPIEPIIETIPFTPEEKEKIVEEIKETESEPQIIKNISPSFYDSLSAWGRKKFLNKDKEETKTY